MRRDYILPIAKRPWLIPDMYEYLDGLSAYDGSEFEASEFVKRTWLMNAFDLTYDEGLYWFDQWEGQNS